MSNKFNELDNYINNIINTEEDYIDIDNLLKIINSLDLNIKQKNLLLKKVYFYNLKITKRVMTNIEELQNIDDLKHIEIADLDLNIPKLESFHNNKNKSMNNKIDIKNYISMIENFNDASDFTILNEIIDEREIFDIINYLLAYYSLELITLKKLQSEDHNSFKEEEIKLTNIIDNLHFLQNSVQKDNIFVENKLIYLTTQYGNSIFMRHLNKISTEYYNSINTVFNSIKNGNFKNNKRLGRTDDGFYSPLLQVRDNQIRIFYLKISANLYLIADIMVKKFAVCNSYSRYIRQISRAALSSVKKFTMMLPSEQTDFLKQNELVTHEVENILNSKKKVLK